MKCTRENEFDQAQTSQFQGKSHSYLKTRTSDGDRVKIIIRKRYQALFDYFSHMTTFPYPEINKL